LDLTVETVEYKLRNFIIRRNYYGKKESSDCCGFGCNDISGIVGRGGLWRLAQNDGFRRQRFKRENDYIQAQPDLVIPSTEASDVIINKVLDLFN
jgi:hypothetical protein